MANLTFEGNTEEILETATKLTPGPFREKSKAMMIEALIKKVGEDGTVTEPIMVEAIKETTPKPFLPIGMKKIKHLLKGTY